MRSRFVVLERWDDCHPRGTARRCQPTQHGRDETHRERKNDRPAVEGKVEIDRHRQPADEAVEDGAEPTGEEKASGAAGKRKYQTFGQQLAYQSAAASAKCEPNTNLSSAGRASTQEKTGNVRAADEQQQPRDDRHRADEQEERRERSGHASELADAFEGEDLGRRKLPRDVGVLRANLPGDELCRRLSLCRGDAGLEPGNDHVCRVSAILHRLARRRRIDRQPEVAGEAGRLGATKRGRHDAEDFDTPSAEGDCPPDDRRVAVESGTPGAIAEHDDIGPCIGRKIDAATLRRHAEHRQVVGRCGFAKQAYNLGAHGHPCFEIGVGRDVGEDGIERAMST